MGVVFKVVAEKGLGYWFIRKQLFLILIHTKIRPELLG